MEENAHNSEREVAAAKLAMASFILGLISLFSSFCCCPFIFGALGLIFALISKGGKKEMLPRAKTGMIMSIIGLIVSVCVVFATVAMPFILTKLNPAYASEFMKPYQEELERNEEMYRQMYGDEVYKQMEDLFKVPQDR